ncbi:hypothetical protein N8J89_21695 [Crossiella sp. CA-258035]|uniref:hypothetical protein n=1 Tax=Crossiella sp. CA-258035 TaxID=2981138 RepID=UPI0024BC1EE9|nr:hypothetical protein [Crossiella sp. CA-258035]WHT15753.1 hypothetical protein N8J89_21695 [Crossiella sp. CA-258035]
MRRGPNGWVLFAAFGALVLVALLIQGLTVHKIGFGPLSVQFGQPEKPKEPPTVSTGSTAAAASSGDAKSVTGNWQQTRVKLTVAVTKVVQSDGRVTLHAKVSNGAADAVNLPLFGYFTATDDTGATYKANPQDSDWPQSVASGVPATGTIELASPVTDRARSLTVSFTQVFGLRAPSGGITIRGVPIPR